MKKIEFVQQTRINSSDIWFYTSINDCYVSDSGSFDKEVAYEKFTILSNGGSLEPVKTILETKTID